MYVNGQWIEDTHTDAERVRDAEAHRQGLNLYYRRHYGRELPADPEQGEGPTAEEVASSYMRAIYRGPKVRR